MLESPSRIAGAATQAHWQRERGGRGTLDEPSPRPTRGDLCRPPCRFSTAARMRLSSALEVFPAVAEGARLGRSGLPTPHCRTFAAAILASALSEASALCHPWLRWPPTPVPVAWAAHPSQTAKAEPRAHLGSLERRHRHTGKGSEGVGERSTSLRRGPLEETCAAPLPVLHRSANALASDLWHCRCSFPLNRGWGL